MLRQAASLLLLLGGGAAIAASPPAGPATPKVVVRDGTVTGKLVKAPVAAVVAAIAEQAGAEVRGALPAQREVTLDLEAVPLEDALERLLGSRSFTLTYHSDGRLKRIVLGSGTQAPNPPGSPHANVPAPSATDSATAEANARVGEYVRSNQPVPVGGRLGQALGTDTATFQQVMRAALKNEDPRVRAEARRSMVKAMVADSTVRDALVATVNGMPDDTLAKAFRGVAGAEAEQLAMAFARYGRSPALSRRMQQAISELRRQGDGS